MMNIRFNMGGNNMTIIVGVGELGKKVKKNFLNNEKDIVWYDNDRRKWGRIIENIKVITLDELLYEVKKGDNKIIVGVEKPSLLHFIKDLKPICSVWHLTSNDELEEFDINSIEAFKYENAKEVGEKNLAQYKKRLEELKKENNIKKYNHALDYIEWKSMHLSQPEISSIEFTNNCNLQCPNCPNSTLSFHKGYITDEIFETALKYIPPYKNETVAVHCMGEPLLHPKIFTYLNMMAEIGINIMMSTNGLLLDKEKSEVLLDILSKVDKSVLYISFHTKKSVENWFNFLKIYKKDPAYNKIYFCGQVLEHNAEQAHNWLKDIGIKDIYDNPNIRHITSHSWGGNVAERRKVYSDIEVRNRIRNCYYLRNRKVAVMWDGTLRGCCYDSNATQKCGNIFDYGNSDINPFGYDLCKCCDPDWITNYQ